MTIKLLQEAAMNFNKVINDAVHINDNDNEVVKREKRHRAVLLILVEGDHGCSRTELKRIPLRREITPC